MTDQSSREARCGVTVRSACVERALLPAAFDLDSPAAHHNIQPHEAAPNTRRTCHPEARVLCGPKDLWTCRQQNRSRPKRLTSTNWIGREAGPAPHLLV
jgi:hypothetical protein